ncbi:hypothetical protein CCR75_006777 [Bremia lactucae]|uniref:valine--tRNA ligase n=1 Tax=Bremia lactucae TaxID=4779 RepID=A0A976IFX0_BRELC|nr:hypothetical protein CCR75_006777 [Bremia lactucae]
MLAQRGCLKGLVSKHVRRCSDNVSKIFKAHTTLSVSKSLPVVSLTTELRERVKIAPLAVTYNPTVVEQGWQQYWQQALRPSTHPDSSKRSDKVFRMILPPPNVTGALHIGHALTITIQDVIARWHCMRGFDVQWLPGLDHAGIATQSVVEKKLRKERGLSRYDLGREAFVDQVWQWKHQFGDRILNQMDHLGALVTKNQAYFTLDTKRSEAVRSAFVHLYEKGLVSRKERMVHWCPKLQTAISDIEVDVEQLEKPTTKILPGKCAAVEFGVRHRFKYQVADSQEFVQVDTTRPETIFGDVALAVHPDDKRYQALHGKYVLHPFSRKRIPIITDNLLVNMELGTGVVKITPAHDSNDFECSQRHQLPIVQVIDKSGKLCGQIEKRFQGLDRFEARQLVVEALKDMQLYVDKFDHPMALSLCSRSGDVIEPLLMPQWYVDCSHMAKRAADNVRNGVMTIQPTSLAHTWFSFLDNIQEWCVSRQLWWGHRIPAYRLKAGVIQRRNAQDKWFVATSIAQARQKAEVEFKCQLQNDDLEQDVDVLDTWFSSGLLPLSVFGWPHAHDDNCREDQSPLDVMETGSDILFFWVARMAMLCEEFTGRVPFKKILLHPMVRDKAGRKMSKSLGNVIDPLDVINGSSLEQLLSNLHVGNLDNKELVSVERELKKEFPKGIPTCGADALRLTLASYLLQGRHINMDVHRVVTNRQFCNKMWNAVRYALPLLATCDRDRKDGFKSLDVACFRDTMSLADRWILSRLAAVVIEVNQAIADNQLGVSVAVLQRFFIQELCDVYLEFSKPVLYNNRLANTMDWEVHWNIKKKQCAQVTLYQCLDYSMRLLHPFIPFVTEELWQRIHKGIESSILCAPYPEKSEMTCWIDVDAEERMAFLIEVIHGIRSLCHTVKILSSKANESEQMTVHIVCLSDVLYMELKNAHRDLTMQCRVNVKYHKSLPSSLSRVLTHSVTDSCRVTLAVPNDAETTQRVVEEIARLEKRAVKSATAADNLVRRQQESHYREKVPKGIQAQDTQRLTQLLTERQATEKSLAALRELQRL